MGRARIQDCVCLALRHVGLSAACFFSAASRNVGASLGGSRGSPPLRAMRRLSNTFRVGRVRRGEVAVEQRYTEVSKCVNPGEGTLERGLNSTSRRARDEKFAPMDQRGGSLESGTGRPHNPPRRHALRTSSGDAAPRPASSPAESQAAGREKRQQRFSNSTRACVRRRASRTRPATRLAGRRNTVAASTTRIAQLRHWRAGRPAVPARAQSPPGHAHPSHHQSRR